MRACKDGKFEATRLDVPELILVKATRRVDHRGYFMESYSRAEYSKLGIDVEFVQDNHAMSMYPGTVRGLHFQRPPKPQAKLVRALKGSIFDVAVDLRRGSPTYGGWCAATLTEVGGEQLFVPRGFAHGYCTLEPNTEIAYKVDAYYAAECEMGLRWDDSKVGIVWPVAESDAVLNDRDRMLPSLAELDSPFRI